MQTLKVTLLSCVFIFGSSALANCENNECQRVAAEITQAATDKCGCTKQTRVEEDATTDADKCGCSSKTKVVSTTESNVVEESAEIEAAIN